MQHENKSAMRHIWVNLTTHKKFKYHSSPLVLSLQSGDSLGCISQVFKGSVSILIQRREERIYLGVLTL